MIDSSLGSLISQLIRIRIALAVTAAALAGFLLAAGFQPAKALPMALAVFMLAAGASILNQVQERHSDGLMERTCRRPLPQGRLKPAEACLAALLTCGNGLMLLWLLNRQAAMAGVLALLCYNALYTPLKKRSFLALLPGALCGSMAPAIGWLTGGGRPADYRLILLCGLLLLWQIPHFWLFALQNRSDLQRAGLFPGLPLAPKNYALRLIFVWIFALVAATLLLPALGVLPLLPAIVICLLAAGWPTRQFLLNANL